MIERTTEDIMIDGILWDNQRRKLNPKQSDRELSKVWVLKSEHEKEMEEVKIKLRNNILKFKQDVFHVLTQSQFSWINKMLSRYLNIFGDEEND